MPAVTLESLSREALIALARAQPVSERDILHAHWIVLDQQAKAARATWRVLADAAKAAGATAKGYEVDHGAVVDEWADHFRAFDLAAGHAEGAFRRYRWAAAKADRAHAQLTRHDRRTAA